MTDGGVVLHHYLGAVHGLAGPVAVVRSVTESESWIDQGYTTQREVTTFFFDNGVVVRRTTEQDDFPAEVACAECWIVYEVVANGDLAQPVSPARKVFENRCRESFWLSYHRA